MTPGSGERVRTDDIIAPLALDRSMAMQVIGLYSLSSLYLNLSFPLCEYPVILAMSGDCRETTRFYI